MIGVTRDRHADAQPTLDCHRSMSLLQIRLLEPEWDTLPQLAHRWALSVYDAAADSATDLA